VQALVAFIGVIVGAVLSGVVNYYVQKRRSDEEQRRDRVTRERLARAAALVAAMELAEAEAAVDAPGDEARIIRRDSVWTERRELLAEHLGPLHAFPVALAFSVIDRAAGMDPGARERRIEGSHILLDFARVDVLLAYATGRALPDEELVDAALVAAGSPPMSRWASEGGRG
jgi:hypothetical protein